MPSANDANVTPSHKPRDMLSKLFGSSGLGVGIVLVLLPAVVLMLGLGYRLFDGMRLVGLPMLAIFGIIILFGTLALVAMLFQTLGLTNRDEPLALPPGSVRAAIALSLIVLFAIISIMLFQSLLGSTYVLHGTTKAQRDEIVAKAPDRVVESVLAACAAPVPQTGTCDEADLRFDVRMQGAMPPTGASDLAKQLLVLVGTLMTSVTSFYFAGRGQTDLVPKDEFGDPTKTSFNGNRASSPSDTETHIDGCEVPITDTTADIDLPVARGGVAPPSQGTGA